MGNDSNEIFCVDTLTFEQVGDLAWEIGEDSITSWAQEFNKFSEEHYKDLNKALEDFSVLYGVPKPDRTIVVDMHHNPIEGNTNGGPRSNYKGMESIFPMISNMGDIMYRLPQYESNSALYVSEQTIKLLHEVEHTFFQNKHFITMVKNVVVLPDIAKKLEKIFSQGGVTNREYADEPLELITTYLENIVSFNPSSEIIDSTPLLIFRVDKELQTALIEIEATQYNENPNGASAKFVTAWKKLLEEHLDIISNVPQEEVDTRNSTTKESPLSKYKDVYQLGKALDPSLAYEYLNSHKPIDEDFIKRLVKMAEKKVFE